MTQPFTLTDAMFDAEGNCIEPFAFDLSSPNGIESLQVTVGSTNSQFLASMAAIQLPETFDLCALDASSAAGIILKGFGYPVGSELKGRRPRVSTSQDRSGRSMNSTVRTPSPSR